MDPKSRDGLIEKLSTTARRASTKVSTEVKASRGDYQVVIGTDSIDHFYRGTPVGSIKVAELDNEVIEACNEDPSDFAGEYLGHFISSFDADAWTREAAHATQSEETLKVVTEKQLANQKIDYHPRPGAAYDNITEKQLPENDERHGTYDQITEGQLRDEDTTFKDEPMAHDRQDESRNTVTERQLENASEYSEHQQTERGQTGSQFDGGMDAQQRMIGEKQLIELLKHHEWTEPKTITEGDDQLGQQDGELSRLDPEWVEEIIQKATTALGRTVLASGTVPSDLALMVRRLVSHESKYPVLADTIKKYAGSKVNDVDSKIKWMRHWKSASGVSPMSVNDTASVLMRELSQIEADPRHLVYSLVGLASQGDLLSERIDKASQDVLAGIEPEIEKTPTAVDVFKSVAAGEHKKPIVEGSAEDDGMYEYVGHVSEVDADINDKEAFSDAAIKVASAEIHKNVGEKIDLVKVCVSVDGDKSEFRAVMKDAKKAKDEDEDDEELKARAEKRQTMAKEASVKEAQVPPGGDMTPPGAGGAPMMNPEMPGGDPGAAAPPGEALGTPPPAMDEGEPGEGEPKPPGTICPSCASTDVDVDNGEFRCNTCGAEGNMSVRLELTKWPETLHETETEEEEGLPAEEGLEPGAPMPAPEEEAGTTMPSVPVGASIHLTPLYLEKVAEGFAVDKKGNKHEIKMGSRCPRCGSHDTYLHKAAKRAGYDGVCWSCFNEYNFKVKASKDKKNEVYAEWIWLPKEAEDCEDCNKLKTAFKKSLANYGVKWDDFVALNDTRKQADTILKMAKSGSLEISDAMAQPLDLIKVAASPRWTGYENVDKFPSASCREMLSRRFGENATAMAGPCQGEKLADCVCGQLETLGIYTDGLAAKVAASLADKDPEEHSPTESCVEMLVRANYSIDDACIACDGLRAAIAGYEDLVIENIGRVKPEKTAQLALEAPETDVLSDEVPSEGPELDDAPIEDEVPVTDEVPEGGMGDMVEVEFAPGPSELEPELGEGGISVKLDSLFDQISELVDVLKRAINADLGEGEFEDLGAEPDLGVEEITDDTVGDEGESEIIEIDEGGEESESLPPEAEEEESGPPDLEDEVEEDKECGMAPAESKECEDKPMESDNSDSKECSDSKPMEESKSDEKDKTCPTCGQTVCACTTPASAEQQEKIAAQLDQELMRMKQGTITTENAGTSRLFDALMKSAKVEGDGEKEFKYIPLKEKKPPVKPAQDAEDVGKVKDGKTIGDEDKFTDGVEDGFDAPRAQATIGREDASNTVSEEPPSVPQGSSKLDGEKDYDAGAAVLDGNQGGGVQVTAEEKEEVKTAETEEEETKTVEAKTYTVGPDHSLYPRLIEKTASGQDSVNLKDGYTYNIDVAENKTVTLTRTAKAEKTESLEKEADMATVKRTKEVEDLPNIDNTSGNETHPRAVTEEKPRAGLADPEVPTAPDDGRLSKEETSETPKDLPDVPVGGGMHPDYDKNKKNTPELQEDITGVDKATTLASTKDRKKAAQVAGLMLKAGRIETEDLETKIEELAKLEPGTLAAIEDSLKEASNADNKGLQKEASGVAETGLPVVQASAKSESGSGSAENLIEATQSLFTLSERNSEHEAMQKDLDDFGIFRHK